MKNSKISILGLGMMGQAIAAGLVKAHHAKRLLAGTTRTRAAATRLRAELGIAVGVDNAAAGRRAGEGHIATARRIFAPLGRVIELEEKHMNTVTGLSASGPAFVYVILEALADGGVARGLPRQTAIEMAAQMVYGAASMVLATGRHPAALKDDVTTPRHGI